MAEDVVVTPPAADPAALPAPPDPKALEAELTRVRTELAEKDAAVRYWHEQAKTAPPTKAATPKADEVEEDVLELLTREGAKGLDKILERKGFVRQDQVEQQINQRARQISTENELATTYPDLKDTKSEFFKATSAEYGSLVRDGVPQHIAMKLAAERAELAGYKSGKKLSAADKEEREARARAQGGTRGAAPAAKEPENEDLDDFQKYICDALEIEPDAYKKRAKEGVRIGGARNS